MNQKSTTFHSALETLQHVVEFNCCSIQGLMERLDEESGVQLLSLWGTSSQLPSLGSYIPLVSSTHIVSYTHPAKSL